MRYQCTASGSGWTDWHPASPSNSRRQALRKAVTLSAKLLEKPDTTARPDSAPPVKKKKPAAKRTAPPPADSAAKPKSDSTAKPKPAEPVPAKPAPAPLA